MDVEFYESFLDLCKKKGESKTKVCASAIGSKNAYARWEHDGSPTLDSLRKLSRYFDVTIGELVGEIKEPVRDDGQDLTDEQRELIRLCSRLKPQEVGLLLSQVKGIILGR